ncbi:VOC family protein [Palleronia sp. LCG004]|uniref:VOC family protein n=1 Tax=Palleronia sp. LCG004 TaxID=3079304 RepID=UPI002942F623|nr:VOC family protein [Palleronia sp. LCG004]WOI55348.1 VOC family protein [Palleronia sp. LCG004]
MDIDHLAIVATDLDEGTSAVEQMLGAKLEPGGRHPVMGTHNRVLSLGSDVYLEVIAVDPEADAPDRSRWFALDEVSGPPRLGNWVARCTDLRAQLGEAPMGMGEVMEFERGDLAWSMAVPRSGRLPEDGILPALIQWKGARPQSRLAESPVKLKRIVLGHPEMERITAEWPALAQMTQVALEITPTPSLVAEIVTPRGLVSLSSLGLAG